MDDDAGARCQLTHVDPRHKTHRRAHLRGEEINRGKRAIHRRQRGVKGEGQTSHGRAKFVVPTAIPGHDPVKLSQAGQRPFRSLNCHHIQAGRGDAFHSIRKPDERPYSARHPDLGICGPQMLQSRHPDDTIADRPRADQQRLQRKSTAMRTSTVFGGKHIVSEHA